ncbi:hypothetical protein Gotur_001445 [Gossypium turneri]
MVDLHNVGTFNADTGFKAGYLNKLEKIGKSNSGFGWDEHRQVVVVEDASHKEAGQFKHRSFLYYGQLIAIWQKIKLLGKMLKQSLILLKK